MQADEDYMKLCIELAKKGSGKVSPNPLVGCVIVKNGRIIGKGYHKKFGDAHAEVNAISEAKKNSTSVKNSTVYVNLEPCSHFGKKPPCTDALINAKVEKVVIGMIDPYVKVNGRGIQKLRDAGIQVSTGILEEQCKELNKFFVKYVTRNLPYVTLKIAQSIDGKIALKNGESKWITGEVSRKLVHKLRSEYDAVLIGKGTAECDDPSLSVRDLKGRNPARIIITGSGKISSRLKIFNDENSSRTIIFSSKEINVKNFPAQNVIIMRDKKFRLKEVLKNCYKRNIQSILVEGGSKVFSEFLKDDLYDELMIFTAPKIIGEGISAFDNISIKNLSGVLSLENLILKKSGEDFLFHNKKCSQE